MFLAEEIIADKKSGKNLSSEQIGFFVNGISDHSISSEQIAALAMAIHFQGMNIQETTDLTIAMRNSGQFVNRKDFNTDFPVVDKHSTGGIGDCVSLILAPLLACYGYYVPMIAGRGLGHTGGTIDKLESIPGYTAEVETSKFIQTVKKHGCAIVGQSDFLTPADKRFYAVRDTTATINILPLIVASILSKKLSEGIDGLIMDIKVGNGAFMQGHDQAQKLAKLIQNVSETAGVKTAIQYNDMNQPLCPVAGNAIEIDYVIRHLAGEITSSRLLDNVFDLAIQLIQLFEKETSQLIKKKLLTYIESGAVYEKFNTYLYALGCKEIKNFHFNNLYNKNNLIYEVFSPFEGIIKAIDTKGIGLLLVQLKAGRKKAGDIIDYGSGISNIPEIGEKVSKGDVLGYLHGSVNLPVSLKDLSKQYISFFDIDIK